MNIQDAIKLLYNHLLKYDNDYIFHPNFVKELKELLQNELNGKEEKFLQGLVTQLENIGSFRRLVYKVDDNEILKNVGLDPYGKPYELMSIHISSNQYNIRLLVRFDSNNNPVFLTAFEEKAGKKKSKNSYSKHIPIAKERYEELHGGII